MSAALLARPEIAALKPYRTARQEPGTVRLNANEVPQAPAPGLNRYPAIRPDALERRIGALLGIGEDRLLATRGSSEAIDLLIRTFCRAYADNIVVAPPTFAMYQVYANMQAAEVIEVPRSAERDFAIDVSAILANANDASKLIFICSPNNPTGGIVPRTDIVELLRARAGRSLVVVDEAYVEFSGERSLVHEVDRFDNLVVLRTLSKARGLAGVRCGAVAASRDVVELLRRMLPPYAFSSPTTDAVLNALADDATAGYVTAIVSERERLRDALAKLDGVEQIWPSEANFLLVRFRDLGAVECELANRRILIRAFDGYPGLENCARITVGSPDENALLLDALRETVAS